MSRKWEKLVEVAGIEPRVLTFSNKKRYVRSLSFSLTRGTPVGRITVREPFVLLPLQLKATLQGPACNRHPYAARPGVRVVSLSEGELTLPVLPGQPLTQRKKRQLNQEYSLIQPVMLPLLECR